MDMCICVCVYTHVHQDHIVQKKNLQGITPNKKYGMILFKDSETSAFSDVNFLDDKK